MANLRPMLAASFDDPQNIEPELTFLRYPVLASPKVDGIRWMKPPGEPAMSRSWKPLPNQQMQDFMVRVASTWMDYLDGEVIVGDNPAAPNLFNPTQSAVMTRDDTNPLSFYVFDSWMSPSDPFHMRTAKAKSKVKIMQDMGIQNVHYLKHTELFSPGAILAYEQEALEAGYEGIMLRDPQGTYKFGRSTMKQQGLIKVKRFVDDEATIYGFEPLMRNQNEPTKNAFGLQVRSHHQANKVADEMVGKLLCKSERWGDIVVGSGLDDDLRTKMYRDFDSYKGLVISYKYQSHGSQEKPRSPIFKGFRYE